MNQKIKNFIEWIGESEVRIALFALLVTSIVLFLITLLFDPSITFPWPLNLGLYNKPDFWENILVESHGMLLDLFIIGVFIFWLQRRSADGREKKLRIKRYEEQLEDYRGWTENEAAYRVAGVIRRLEDEGVEGIKFDRLHLGKCPIEIVKKAVKVNTHIMLQGADLAHANLQEANLWGAYLQEADLVQAKLQGAFLANAKLQKANLLFVNLHGANLKYANLQKAKLVGTNLQEANLGYANLQEAKLAGANLQEANLDNANLHGANLKDANLHGANLENANLQEAIVDKVSWIEKLKEWNVIGAEYIKTRYYVDEASQVRSTHHSITIYSTKEDKEEIIYRYSYLIKEKPKEENNNARGKCKAIAVSTGKRCENYIKKGFDRCHQHLKQHEQ
ncbi:MAG: pentapeptide repeat-containing protein [Phaeodactylibacter sp.]|nr:pentapeptide repeat-containing protein [Phaeodactylibacter sp.]